jgi:hypothetical protein
MTATLILFSDHFCFHKLFLHPLFAPLKMPSAPLNHLCIKLYHDHLPQLISYIILVKASLINIKHYNTLCFKEYLCPLQCWFVLGQVMQFWNLFHCATLFWGELDCKMRRGAPDPYLRYEDNMLSFLLRSLNIFSLTRNKKRNIGWQPLYSVLLSVDLQSSIGHHCRYCYAGYIIKKCIWSDFP